MIQIENLSLTLQKIDILKDINLSLENGKIHGLIGRNGSGKTMLMKCICGFVHPTVGTIQIDGKYVGKDMDFPEDMGVIIETPEFISYMSGFRNLQLLAKGRKCIGDKEIYDVMKKVNLDPKNSIHVKKYSLGMKQRLGIAQAIMEHPKLLVLDEPFSALDEDGVRDMREMLLQMKQSGVTIILSSHNAEDIKVLCDNVYRLQKGCLVS
ncbi:ATP-binding cassette domain-containing protein [Lachnospiraceae bacterium 66-29]